DDDRGHPVRIDVPRDGPLLAGAADEPAQRAAPVLIRLTDDLGETAIAARAEHELAHHGKQLRFVTGETPQAAEVSPQLIAGRAAGGERRLEPRHRVAHDAADEVLLGRE